MNRRRLLSALIAAGLAAPVRGVAQGKVVRVGFLVPTTRSGFASRIEGFRKGLRELGYVEGQNLHIEYRSVEDDRYDHLPALAAQLVELKVDVLVTGGTGDVSPQACHFHDSDCDWLGVRSRWPRALSRTSRARVETSPGRASSPPSSL